jgi:gamma-glutamyltranspeptidase/glutathione hydrolase
MSLLARIARHVLLLGLVSTAAAAQDVVSPEAATGRGAAKGAVAKSYMTVAANPIAANAGAEILKAGGSAVDAAIAVQAVLNLVEPQSSGFGGGAFLLVWDARAKRLATIDGRETAPAAAKEDRFLTAAGKPMDRMTAVVGGRSVGVPGVLRALELAHRKFGKLPWARLFDPALRVAEGGFDMSPRLHALLAADSALPKIEPARSFYYQADGTPKPVGTLLVNPAFAATLRAVAAGGADAFYRGAIADDIVRTVTAAPVSPGDIARADLEGYRAVERPPVCGPYRGHTVCGMGPPTSGGIGVIQVLGMVERFDLARLGPKDPNARHLLIEANRLAFADRAVYIDDPDAIPVPTDALLARDYLAQRSALIAADRRMADAPAGKVPVKGAWRLVPAASPELPSTSHFSIVDRSGNAVAMTTSVENSFGSRLMVDGFLLNNTLTDFSYDDAARGATVANRVGPNKRPRSSMAPTMVFDGKGRLEMVLGSPGGPAIVAFVVKTLVAMIDWKMTPADATAAPYAIGFGRAVTVEPPLAEMAPALRALGHDVRLGEFPSGVHAIRITRQGLLGGADPRREGAAVGE